MGFDVISSLAGRAIDRALRVVILSLSIHSPAEISIRIFPPPSLCQLEQSRVQFFGTKTGTYLSLNEKSPAQFFKITFIWSLLDFYPMFFYPGQLGVSNLISCIPHSKWLKLALIQRETSKK
jgi:hypothetical protein